jgi:hypothetical protein
MAAKRNWSRNLTTASDCTLHQLAPYIGRMKTSMARSLVRTWTRRGDLVVDPFCGAGVIPLESVLLDRRVFAGDWNPYAVLLCRAKLLAPRSARAASRRLNRAWSRSRELLGKQDLRRVPKWVRAFFNAETLRSALALRDACVELQDDFVLACLLGILHHQRPGFLSYPSSHLVPYLRTRKFPPSRYPGLYLERDVLSRMERKIQRTYRRVPAELPRSNRIELRDARHFPRIQNVKAVITSPPYMNELDYVRDNRLRLWFLERELPRNLELPARDRCAEFVHLMRAVCCRLANSVISGGYIILVVGDATRGGGRRGRTADLTRKLFRDESALAGFSLVWTYTDQIPDVRRSRRECKGTKTETILVYRKRRTDKGPVRKSA